jgi:RHS repeat-associated protein
MNAALASPVVNGLLTIYFDSAKFPTTGDKTFTFGYDTNGNTIAENTRQYIYNQNQRLIRAVDGQTVLGEYVYNGNGQRVKKTTASGITVLHYDLQGKIMAESTNAGSMTAEYVFLNGNPFAKIEGSNVYYYHNDHLGTPQKMTNSGSTVVWYGEFLPFGEPLSITGTITNNLRFPGQYFDEETGLHYNYFRDYEPMIGRYIEADPIGIIRGENRLYTYVGNNSINIVDPDGLQQEKKKTWKWKCSMKSPSVKNQEAYRLWCYHCYQEALFACGVSPDPVECERQRGPKMYKCGSCGLKTDWEIEIEDK